MTKNLSLIFLLITFYATSIFLNQSFQYQKITINKQNEAVNINEQFLTISFSSYKRLIADIYWVVTLLESDLEHYKGKDLNNWMFLRFKTISTLDPLFLNNYKFGGQYLSIIKDDQDGAQWLLEKGLSFYPKDYTLIFNTGYLYTFEKENYERAYQLFDIIKDNNKAPSFIKSLMAKIKYGESKDLKLVFEVLTELYNTTEDKYLKQNLFFDRYRVKAEMDLDCLNKNQKNCSLIDLEGNSYFKKNGRYIAKKPFTPYSLNKRN